MISTTGVTRGLWFISNPIEGVTPNERVLGSLSVIHGDYQAVFIPAVPITVWSPAGNGIVHRFTNVTGRLL